jgi:hypothetical protein
MFAVSVLSATGCDPGDSMTFVNQTRGEVRILVDGINEANLAPCATQTFDFLRENRTRLFEARDASRVIIYSEALTRQQLKDQNWHVIIGEDQCSP